MVNLTESQLKCLRAFLDKGTRVKAAEHLGWTLRNFDGHKQEAYRRLKAHSIEEAYTKAREAGYDLSGDK